MARRARQVLDGGVTGIGEDILTRLRAGQLVAMRSQGKSSSQLLRGKIYRFKEYPTKEQMVKEKAEHWPRPEGQGRVE